MKGKKSVAWIAALCAAVLCVGFLAACNDGGDKEKEPQTYAITVQTSEDYALTPDKTTAAAGEKITVSAEVKNADKYLTGVKYNDLACTESDGNYTFTMPAEDVTLTAVTGTYAEVLEDGMATFSAVNSKTIAKTETADTATLLVLFDQNYMTGIKYEIASSDESVIPVSAITVREVKNSDLVGSSGSNTIEQAEVNIDTSKVSLGSTWLTMYFKGTAGSSASGTITVKITVAETVTVEKWTETLVFDVSSLRYGEDALYYIRVNDNNYITGSGAKESQIFDEVAAVDEEVTVQIEYVPGHTYSITFGYIDAKAEHGYTWHNLNEAKGSGSSVTGFNQYDDGELSFISDGQSLKIKVAKTTHT